MAVAKEDLSASSDPLHRVEAEPAPEPKGPDALADLANKIAQLNDSLSVYLDSQVEQIKLALREFVAQWSFIPLILFFLGGAIFVAVGFFFYGVALWLTIVFEGKSWLAYLATGGGFLLALVLALALCFKVVRARSYRRRLKEYEKELQKQQARFGSPGLQVSQK
jgi:pilus assembly protein TadC